MQQHVEYIHNYLVGQTYVYSIRAISSFTSLLQEHSPLNNSLRRMVTKMTLNKCIYNPIYYVFPYNFCVLSIHSRNYSRVGGGILGIYSWVCTTLEYCTFI